MTVLVWGVAAGAFAFVLHLAIWRVRVPRRQLRSVGFVFFGVLAAALAAQWVLPRVGVTALPRLADAPEVVAFVLFFVAWTLAYMISYTSIEVDSPSMAVVRRIDAMGTLGLPREDLESLASNARMVTPRVLDLVRDGMLVDTGGSYALTPKGRRFLALIDAYHAVLGTPKGG